MLREMPKRRRRGVIAGCAVAIAAPIALVAVSMLPASAAAVPPLADGVYTLAPAASASAST